MAKELGLFEKYGVNVEVSKEASWANVRDKILTGELDGAHCLFSMPFSVYTGVGGKEGSEMKVAMILNNNGQAITFSKDFCGKVGFKQTNKVASVVAAKLKAEKEVTFAMTFPGGTHDIWLRYWLAAAEREPENFKNYHDSSSSNGGQHESREHGWILCRRTVEWCSRETRHWLYRNFIHRTSGSIILKKHW